jgi:hypothetical protein
MVQWCLLETSAPSAIILYISASIMENMGPHLAVWTFIGISATDVLGTILTLNSIDHGLQMPSGRCSDTGIN